MMYTLRYVQGTPVEPRPHRPTEARFDNYADADDHLEAQPNKAVLEVVER